MSDCFTTSIQFSLSYTQIFKIVQASMTLIKKIQEVKLHCTAPPDQNVLLLQVMEIITTPGNEWVYKGGSITEAGKKDTQT